MKQNGELDLVEAQSSRNDSSTGAISNLFFFVCIENGCKLLDLEFVGF